MRHQKHSAESLGGGSQAKPCNAAVANQHGLRCYSHHQRLSLSVLPLEENWWQSGCHRKEHKRRHGKATTSGKMRPKACQRHFSVDNHRISHPRLFYLSILKRQGSRLEQSELYLIHPWKEWATYPSLFHGHTNVCQSYFCFEMWTDRNWHQSNHHKSSSSVIQPTSPKHTSNPFGWKVAASSVSESHRRREFAVLCAMESKPWRRRFVSVLSSTCRFSPPEIPALHFLLQPLVDTLHCDALLPRRLFFFHTPLPLEIFR